MANSNNNAAKAKSEAAAQPTQISPKVRWDISNLKSSYSNVCNVTSTREEVVLNFGINQAWERGTQDLEIQLTNRVILSPFAAKRLSTMLSKLVSEYETKYGELNLESATEMPVPSVKN